jgi:hypothetical protein
MSTADPRATPLVTVVIPLYDKGKWIGRAVDSVLRQTWSNLELIVVDDGSRDEGPEIVGRYVDSRLTVVRQANQGPGAARNNGWRHGSATIVAFLDADESGSIRIAPETPLRRFRAVLTHMFPVSTIVRRSVLERFGGFYDAARCTYGEDSFLWLRVLLNYTVCLSEEPRVVIDRAASALSTVATLATRSLEPVLAVPEEIRRVCPPQLQGLLATLLADKALKRACTLGAVGKWREAATLRRRFAIRGAWRLRYGWASLLVANPIGSGLATLLLRILRPTTRKP